MCRSWNSTSQTHRGINRGVAVQACWSVKSQTSLIWTVRYRNYGEYHIGPIGSYLLEFVVHEMYEHCCVTEVHFHPRFSLTHFTAASNTACLTLNSNVVVYNDAVPLSRLDNETLKRLITPLPILMQNQPARYSLPAHALRTPFSLPLPALLKIPSWDLATRQHLGKSDVSSDASALLHAVSGIPASASSHSRPRFSA